MNAAAGVLPARHWLGEFLLLSALWGASFLFMRLGASEFGPLPTAGLRVSLATLLLWPILLRQGQWPALRRHWKPILLGGVINSAIPFALYAWAVLHITTGLSSILNATVPLFGALVAWAWLGDRIGRLRWAGLAIGFAGVALLAWRAPAAIGFKSDHAIWAVGACLLATTCYAIGASYARQYLAGLPPLATATGSQLGATLALALPALWSWPARAPGPGPRGLGRGHRHRRAVHGHRLHPVLPPDRACRAEPGARRDFPRPRVRGGLRRPVPGRIDHAMDARLRRGHRVRHHAFHRAGTPARTLIRKPRRFALRQPDNLWNRGSNCRQDRSASA